MNKVTIPKPPSINQIYKYTSKGGYARSYISKKGREWFKEAAIELNRQWRKRTPIDEEVEVYLTMYTAYYHQDVDNVLKPILDLLEKEEVIENDKLIYKLDIEKRKSKKKDERVEIEIFGY